MTNGHNYPSFSLKLDRQPKSVANQTRFLKPMCYPIIVQDVRREWMTHFNIKILLSFGCVLLVFICSNSPIDPRCPSKDVNLLSIVTGSINTKRRRAICFGTVG